MQSIIDNLMSMCYTHNMEPGNIVEYIEQKDIKCAVVLETKKQRLRILTENNREVNLSLKRLVHTDDVRLNLEQGRDYLVDYLHSIVARRKTIQETIDVEELWEVLYNEEDSIDVETMTGLCFDDVNDDNISAVYRAMLHNKFYFKFTPESFFPYSETQVENLKHQAREAERKLALIDEGGDWLKKVMNNPTPNIPSDKLQTVDILKSVYLFGKESDDYDIARGIVDRAGVDTENGLLKLLIKLGAWDENENLDLYRFEIPQSFSPNVLEQAETVKQSTQLISPQRKDLTRLDLITIDGQATTDHDDALSIEWDGDQFCLGIHIADVAACIEKNSPIDISALDRATSIYTPDLKIPMLPPVLAENICSLKADETRPAISMMTWINDQAQVSKFEIFSSVVKVKHQLTYHDANLMVNDHPGLRQLHELACSFRDFRLNNEAVYITLPEIHIRIDEDTGEIIINRVNRENACRMLVAESMILGNWVTAQFLRQNQTPAIYRSQPPPKERLFEKQEGTLFENWMQRKHLSRFVLSCKPSNHSGLGLDCYVTSTSPIRKYYDLVTQRQIRSILGFGNAYTKEEINHIIQHTRQTMTHASRLQFGRNRYWIIKYLEQHRGIKTPAMVLEKRWHNYTLLLTDYLLESSLPISSAMNFEPEDMIEVTINRADARNNILSVALA
ncbi:MAG: exoribonuclease II [Candidatus Magnetoglobus multicellularis str. Araruama]|uniref:Exoribonuclease II n=1 Tax=Candidatus Magnetoglobus multicellularis str. Araruama TaxID=890399 RepID=A0A1V1PFN9_9BACT|nr:MAG: exoribonuclease II [Candidatus Magnetoglobus multicellularis str. Araruama]